MSRGPGRVQREVLEILRDDLIRADGWQKRHGGMFASSIVWTIAKRRDGFQKYEDPPIGWQPSDAVYKSVMRAIRSLVKRGMVQTRRKGHWGKSLLLVQLSVERVDN